jgi:hypothetical protein
MQDFGDLKIQDLISDIFYTDIILYLLFGFAILILNKFVIPYLLRIYSSNYASFLEKAGSFFLIIILVFIPLYSFYLGYCRSLLYEIWPLSLVDFLFFGFFPAILYAFYGSSLYRVDDFG